MSWTRTKLRQCVSCGVTEQIRADSIAIRCRKCTGRINGARGREAIMARAQAARHPCAHCGKLTKAYRQYCSRKCYIDSRPRVTLICEACGVEFTHLTCKFPPVNKTTNARGRFCSQRCKADFQRN